MIISLHIPKTAGTTFRAYLEAAFPGGVLLDYARTEPDMRRRFTACSESEYSAAVACGNKYNLPQSPEGIASFKRIAEAGRVRVIHGHFRRARYIAIYPDGDYITWVREPLARARSHFLFHRRILANPNDAENVLIHTGKLAFRDWLENPEHINEQYRFTSCGKLEKFKFVGLVEEFAAGIALFNRIFGIAGVTRPNARRNANPDKGTDNEIDPTTAARFKALNAADYDLYRRVREQYQPLKSQQ